MLEMYSIDDVACDDLPRGVLIGTVELWECTGVATITNGTSAALQRAEKLVKPTKHPQPVWFNPF